MAEVKWIKITTDMFDNRKIKYLRTLPDGNDIVLIWVMLLTMAGRCNANGMIFLTENIPYTSKMLSDELGFQENTVILALKSLESLGMICSDERFFSIANWEFHQNIEGLDKIKEQNRKRVAEYRKKKLEEKCNVTRNVTTVTGNITGNATGNVTVMHGNAIEEDIEEEKEREKRIQYKAVQDAYNRICISLPNCRSLSDARKKSIKARMNDYSFEEFVEVFEKVEKSDFLTGRGKGSWNKCNLDWILNGTNFAKILDGNYDNKTPVNSGYNQNPADSLDDIF